MLIVTVLRAKGDSVATIAPTATVRDLLGLLAEQRIGAVVVTADDAIAGIVSEHDVVRRLADDGGALLDRQVAEIMTVDVVTCTKETSVEDLARTMTERRIRHVPVVDADGALVGIVSIGDVVKSRISELEGEHDDLVGYIGAALSRQPEGGGGRIRFSWTSVAANRPFRSWIDPRYTPRTPAADTGSSSMNNQSSARVGRWK